MASQTITADFTSTITVPDAGDILVIEPGVTGVVNFVAIDARAIANSRVFDIAGDVTSLGSSDCMTIGIGALGGSQDNVVNIRKTGALRSEEGAALFANAQSLDITNRGLLDGQVGLEGKLSDGLIQNKGEIRGSERGIELDCFNVTIINEGLIKSSGSTAITLTGQAAQISNEGTIRSQGPGPAIELIGEEGDFSMAVLVSGRLISGGLAVEANEAMSVTIESGAVVKGDIQFGAGSSSLFLRGKLDGTILAGSGACGFDLGTLTPEIVDGGGIYSLRATIDTVLPDFFVNLQLTGRGDINGTGNDLDNTIGGNNRDNVLRGLGGADAFFAGLGDDKFFLGEGADSLQFSNFGGDDKVMDFVPGEDIFDINSLPFDDFADVQAQLFNVKGGVEFREGESVIFFKGLKKGDLGEDSFEFL